MRGEEFQKKHTSKNGKYAIKYPEHALLLYILSKTQIIGEYYQDIMSGSITNI
jgi:hypothetical protein